MKGVYPLHMPCLTNQDILHWLVLSITWCSCRKGLHLLYPPPLPPPRTRHDVSLARKWSVRWPLQLLMMRLSESGQRNRESLCSVLLSLELYFDEIAKTSEKLGSYQDVFLRHQAEILRNAVSMPDHPLISRKYSVCSELL